MTANNMINLIRSVLALLIVTFISIGQGYSQSSDWHAIESSDNGFRIHFPQEPEVNPRIVNTGIGELTLDVYMYEVNDQSKDDNLVYSVICTEYPASIFQNATEETLKVFFRNSVDGAVNNVHGALLSELIIQYDGHLGREIKIDFREGLAIITMRMYLIGNKMYMIQTITETNKDFNTSISRFMDSFRLI
jgi:hypothetical protein